jgi:DNA-binding NarL/FixJ family response regulator
VSRRIAVADHEELSRAGLRLFLDREPSAHVVAEARDGHEALDVVMRTRPDFLVAELELPGISGTAVAQSLRHRLGDSAPWVILVSREVTNRDFLTMFAAGVSGLLTRAAARSELLGALRAAEEGHLTLSPAFATQLLTRFSLVPATDEDEPPPELADLNDRELSVLARIARGRSYAEIASELHLARATVKTYASAIFEKLGVRDRLQAALLAHHAGFVEPSLAHRAVRPPNGAPAWSQRTERRASPA